MSCRFAVLAGQWRVYNASWTISVSSQKELKTEMMWQGCSHGGSNVDPVTEISFMVHFLEHWQDTDRFGRTVVGVWYPEGFFDLGVCPELRGEVREARELRKRSHCERPRATIPHQHLFKRVPFNLLVQCKRAPEGGQLDNTFIILLVLDLESVQPHLNAEPNALASIVSALGIPRAAGLSDSHDTQRLNGCQAVMAVHTPKQALGLVEKVVAGRMGIVWIRAYLGPIRETRGEGAQCIDQKG